MGLGPGPWSREQTETLMRLWAANEGVRRIAVVVGRDEAAVNRKAEKLNLPKRVNVKVEDKMEPGQLAEFKRRYLRGETYSVIAEDMGIGITTIKKMRKRLDLKRRGTEIGTPKKQQCHFYLSQTEYDKMRKVAHKQRITMSRFIANAVTARLEQL